MTRTIYDYERSELSELLPNEPGYRLDQLWQGLYTDHAPVEQISTLSKALRQRLTEVAPTALEEVTLRSGDNGKTLKWLWQLADGHQVETVLMLYPDRATVCVSSQAGCAMACSFCATGQAGFDRHLSAGEIIEQIVVAARSAGDRRVSNVVFMGMGEPLANLDRCWTAVERIHADLGLSARSITVSTVGLIPGINRLTESPLPVTLAVSLHAANDQLRNELVPINRRYPLDALCEAMIAYRARKGRRVSLEWALIDGVNDSDRDAEELADIARHVRGHVNLIPLNPTPGYLVQGSPPRRLEQFRDLLEMHGANATIRRTRGLDIDAACGQLAARHRSDDNGSPSGVSATAVELGSRSD